MAEIILARVQELLHLLEEDSGATCTYAKGALVGLFAGLIASGHKTDDVMEIIATNLPPNYREEAIPEAWLDTWIKVV